MLRNSSKPIHYNLDTVRFSVLTSDDIRKLSVTRVITSNVLDNLGHPLPGGLYDLTMGECVFVDNQNLLFSDCF